MFHYAPKYVSIEQYLLKQGSMLLRRYAEIQRFRILRIYRHAANRGGTCLSKSSIKIFPLRKEFLEMRPTKGQ